MVNPVDNIQPVDQECEESSWENIYLLRENGHLKDPESMTIIQQYFLECCRRIWELLPDSGSRKGVEAAEKLCRGEISWEEFFRRLDKTRQVLLKCAEKSPEDPTPWAYLVMVATWYSDPDEIKYEYFNEAVARDSNNWAAHMRMIIALSEKWGGDNEEMIEFARSASSKAPVGSDLKAIVVKAYIEYWKYLDMFEDKPNEAKDFILDEKIQKEIIDAYDNSLAHDNFFESKVSIFVRYNLSGWFWLTKDHNRLKNELATLGNKIEDIHWRWVCTEGELQDARAFVNES